MNADLQEWQEAFILLGTNLGDARTHLLEAQRQMEEHCGRILLSSDIYLSQSWGKRDQPDFLNQVVKISTKMDPYGLLTKLLEIEAVMGRIRRTRWESRIIDLDILFYEDLCLEASGLTIPHPRIWERNFTLVPLMEIAPDFIHPVLQQSIKDLYFACPDRLEVIRLES